MKKIEMNLPNKLTIFRICLIPPFLLFLYLSAFSPANNWIAFGIFILASVTDYFDGKIARERNLITNFGKFMDPLADKLLVCSALIALCQIDRIHGLVVIVIIAREFIISGFRLIASDNGKVIAASWWGKVKTFVQMAAVMLLVIDFKNMPMYVITQILVYVALALTVISLIDYMRKNKDVLYHSNK